MPDDSIMDMVNNVESLYNDKISMFDRWVEEGDVWGERQALREATSLAGNFAELIQGMDGVDGEYSVREIAQAADEMLEEFEEYREEAIKQAVKQATHVPTAEELAMSPGDIAHAEKYDEVARKIGIDFLKTLIPASSARIRKALEKGDKHLNTIPLRKWDAAADNIRASGLSLSEKVCALKHVATWHYA